RAGGDRRPRQVRGPDPAQDEGAHHAAARPVVRLPRHPADADVPSRLPAAQPGRQARGVAGHPPGDAASRPAGGPFVSARRRRALAALAGALMLAGAAAGAGGGEPRLARIVVDGGINPAVAQYVRRAITRAAADDAVALVIQLDTPGGLLQSARAVVKDILAAPLPIVVYVAPSGAVAGSAGVFVTEAAHVAAMAPGTSIGAAHPVGGQGEDIPGTMGKKLENSTASFSEALARQRG